MSVHRGYEKKPKDQLCGNRWHKNTNQQISKTEYYNRVYSHSNKEAFDKWVELSTKQQDESTIRDNILEDQFSVCISFLCKYQKFSEDFLEELCWITSRFFDTKTYNKDIIIMLIRFTDEYRTDEERIEVLSRLIDYNDCITIDPGLSEEERKYLIFTNYKLSNEKMLADALLEMYTDPNYRRDRIDWGELNNWNLSKKFRDKYASEFEKAKMVVNNSDYMEDDSYYNMHSPKLI